MGGWLVQHNLVGADEAEDVAGLFVEEVEIEEFVGESAGFVLHLGDANLESVTLLKEEGAFSFDLDAVEKAEIALHGCEGEIRREAENSDNKQTVADSRRF